MVLEKTRKEKEIKPVNPKGNQPYSIERLIMKLKLQYFSHLIPRANSLEETMMLGKLEGRRGQPKIRWLDGITDSLDLSLNKLQEIVKDKEPWHAGHGVTKSRTLLSDWTTKYNSLHLLTPNSLSLVETASWLYQAPQLILPSPPSPGPRLLRKVVRNQHCATWGNPHPLPVTFPPCGWLGPGTVLTFEVVRITGVPTCRALGTGPAS